MLPSNSLQSDVSNPGARIGECFCTQAGSQQTVAPNGALQPESGHKTQIRRRLAQRSLLNIDQPSPAYAALGKTCACAPLKWGRGVSMADLGTDHLTLKGKEAKGALRTSEVRYRRLFESAQDGILILDAHTGFITDVNPFLIRLLDHPREDFIGKTLWDIGPFKQI
jgi:PAS domain-containing protein